MILGTISLKNMNSSNGSAWPLNGAKPENESLCHRCLCPPSETVIPDVSLLMVTGQTKNLILYTLQTVQSKFVKHRWYPSILFFTIHSIPASEKISFTKLHPATWTGGKTLIILATIQ